MSAGVKLCSALTVVIAGGNVVVFIANAITICKYIFVAVRVRVPKRLFAFGILAFQVQLAAASVHRTILASTRTAVATWVRDSIGEGGRARGKVRFGE